MKKDTQQLLIALTVVLFVALVVLAYVQTKLRADARQRLSMNVSNVRGATDTDPSLFAPSTEDDVTRLSDITKIFSSFTFGQESETEANTTTGGGGSGTADDAAFASRVGPPDARGYYTMPEPVNGEYSLAHPVACRHGSLEMLTLINKVSYAWKAKYPDSQIEVWDINAAGHLSHRNGIDVDIAITNESAANMCSSFYSQPGSCGNGMSEGQCRSIELAKMFISGNIVQFIFYDDQAVDDVINAYAHANNISNLLLMEPFGTQACGAGHHNHFHVRILDQYQKQYWEPDGC